MRFQVPQFIEVEDKIFGQLTLKQFIYLAGGGGLSFLIYTIVGNLFIAIIPIIVIMAAVFALSFYKVNNRPFINTVESAFKYWVGGKLFIWKKEDKVKPQTPDAALREARNFAGVMVPKISDSKLKDLTWSLDIKESVYSNKNQK
jgi:PrgI family protein